MSKDDESAPAFREGPGRWRTKSQHNPWSPHEFGLNWYPLILQLGSWYLQKRPQMKSIFANFIYVLLRLINRGLCFPLWSGPMLPSESNHHGPNIEARISFNSLQGRGITLTSRQGTSKRSALEPSPYMLQQIARFYAGSHNVDQAWVRSS